MKKIYNSPEVKVYCVKAHSVIAASLTNNDVYSNNPQLGKGGYYEDDYDY